MKLKISVFFCLLFCLNLLAQDPFAASKASSATAKSSSKNGKFGDDFAAQLYLMIGIRTLETRDQTTSLFFKVQSNNPDSFYGVQQIKKNTIAWDVLVFGASINIAHDWHAYGQFEIYTQQITGFGLTLGGGYNIYKGNLLIQPNIGLGFGVAGLDYGKITNHDQFIQINDKQFTSKENQISTSNAHFDFKPGVAFTYALTHRFALRGDFGYNLLVAKQDRFNFSGRNSNNESMTEELKLNDPSLVYKDYKSDTRLNSFNIGRNGMFFHLGIAFLLRKSDESVTDNGYQSPPNRTNTQYENNNYNNNNRKSSPPKLFEEKKPTPPKTKPGY